MFCSTNSVGLLGLEPFPISAEVDLSRAIPSFDIVGLPDAAVRESRDRVRSAMINCGFPFPVKKVVVNLAPADTKKAGASLDLAICVGLLQASEQLEGDFSSMAFVGELSLNGEIRLVHGVLPMALGAKQLGFSTLFVPAGNAAEGAAVQGIDVYPVEHLIQLVEHLRGAHPLPLATAVPTEEPSAPLPDFSEVKGQLTAKRALEVAAAGGHNLLMIGPPGTGKSMLAKRLPSILPPLTYEESVEVTQIYSVGGHLPSGGLLQRRPFRAPHHTVSPAGLTGGGSNPKPGEISLAHHGVLFLDELPEFSRQSMEALRQPLEDGVVTISRANARLSYPSQVMLVGAMNPCPCGYFGHPTRACTCTPSAVTRYLSRVSGPLLSRIDLHIEVQPVEYEAFSSPAPEESSREIQKRVIAAREFQRERNPAVPCNARIPPALLQQSCPLDDGANRLLKAAFERMGLSGRAYERILKMARTIADLDRSEVIRADHISEAVQYRSLDRKYWDR